LQHLMPENVASEIEFVTNGTWAIIDSSDTCDTSTLLTY